MQTAKKGKEQSRAEQSSTAAGMMILWLLDLARAVSWFATRRPDHAGLDTSRLCARLLCCDVIWPV
jgi:hypothetical protein